MAASTPIKTIRSLALDSISLTGAITVSGGDSGEWNLAHDKIVTGVSGAGNGILTLTRQDGTTLTNNLAHTHTFSDITGTLTVDAGGTGQTTFTSDQVLVGNGVNGINTLSRSGIDSRSTFPPAAHTLGSHSDVDGDGWSNTNPLMDGTASQGISNRVSRQDHRHPVDTSRAAASHTHGNITNTGTITTDTVVASGDKIVIVDEGDNTVSRSNIVFNESTTHFLRNDGAWAQISEGGTWGQISGVLTDQIDLNGALALKADTADLLGYGKLDEINDWLYVNIFPSIRFKGGGYNSGNTANKGVMYAVSTVNDRGWILPDASGTIALADDYGSVASIDLNSNASTYLNGTGSWTTPPNTTYTAGDGLDVVGTDFRVDGTVVRTTGAQTIVDNKTFSGGATFGNFKIEHNATTDSLDFNYIG